MENPLREVMEEMGYNAKELAMAIDLDYSVVSAHLNGMPRRLSNRVAYALISYGYEPQKLRDLYDAWRREQAEKLRREMTV